jgi:hypothetical protein
MNLRSFPPHLEEAMGAILSFAPVGANQQLVQKRALIAVEDAVDFRRNRVSVSRAEIAPVQWTVIVILSGMILVTIAAIHIMRGWRWRSRCLSFQRQSRCVLFS